MLSCGGWSLYCETSIRIHPIIIDYDFFVDIDTGYLIREERFEIGK